MYMEEIRKRRCCSVFHKLDKNLIHPYSRYISLTILYKFNISNVEYLSERKRKGNKSNQIKNI